METFIKSLALFFGLFLALAPGLLEGQTVIWQDEFNQPNDATSPSVGTRAPELEGGGGTGTENRYFGRCRQNPDKQVHAGSGTFNTVFFDDYSGFNGSFFWAGERHDEIPDPPGNGQSELEIIWSGINITGSSSLIFNGLFAARTGQFESNDYLVVEYKIDADPNWTEGLYISKKSGSSSNDWAVDINGDNVGDSPTLNKTFKEIPFLISETGNSIQIRLRVKVDSNDEEWAVDNFRLLSCDLDPPTITATENSGNPPINNGTICAGASVTLGTSSGPYGSYAWSGGTPSGGTTPAGATTLVSPTTTTTYTLTVTQDGCSASNTREIIVVTPPSPTIIVDESSGTPNNGTICAGTSATLSVGSFTSYAWSGGTPTGGSNPTGQSTMVSPATTTTYTVTVTNSAGCTGTDTQQITVVQSPSPTITGSESSGTAPNDGIICSGASVSLNPGNFPGSTFSWMPGGATSSTLNIMPSSSTTYSVTVTNAAGCTGTDMHLIEVLANPTPTITVSESSGTAPNDGIICSGAQVTLSAGSFSTYDWSPGTGASSSINPSPTTTTTYSVTVINTDGCEGSDSQVITVNPLPNPNISIIEESAGEENDFIICAGADVVLDAGNFSSYLWTPGGASTRTIEPVLLEPGKDTISVKVINNNGCENTDKVVITVQRNPILTLLPEISAASGEDVEISLYDSVDPANAEITWEVLSLDNIRQGVSNFEQDGDDADLPTQAAFLVDNIRAAGLVIYQVVAESQECYDIKEYKVAIFPGEDGCPLFVPELLTPNAGGGNDEWQITPPSGETLADYQVILRDRTGCVVWDSQHGTGNFNPVNCANGVYYYVILDNGGEPVCKGAVTIINQN